MNRRALGGTARAISSWMANTPERSRSRVWDQRWEPSEDRTSWAVTRTRAPSLRTLPSSRVPTPSFCPMTRRSSFLPLNEKDDVRPISQWARAGVTAANGQPLSANADARASLFFPAGADGPAFLVTQNFDALLAYNVATKYALSVSLLANRIAGAGFDCEAELSCEAKCPHQAHRVGSEDRP